LNALYFEKQGAAYVLLGQDADSTHLRSSLEKLLDAQNRRKLSEACNKLCAFEKPAQKIAQIIFNGVAK